MSPRNATSYFESAVLIFDELHFTFDFCPWHFVLEIFQDDKAPPKSFWIYLYLYRETAMLSTPKSRDKTSIYLVHMKNKSMFVSLPSVTSCCDRSRSPWQPPWNFIICRLNICILMQTCDQNIKVVSIPECDIILTADELHHRLKYMTSSLWKHVHHLQLKKPWQVGCYGQDKAQDDS